MLNRGLDVILDTKIDKKFGSHNGFLTQSMHRSENTQKKIKLVTMMKQRRVLLANTSNTAVKENH